MSEGAFPGAAQVDASFLPFAHHVRTSGWVSELRTVDFVLAFALFLLVRPVVIRLVNLEMVFVESSKTVVKGDKKLDTWITRDRPSPIVQ